MTTTHAVPSTIIPKNPSSRITYLTQPEINKALHRLPKEDFQNLKLKQEKLRQPNAQVPTFIEQNSVTSPLLAQAASATLLFVWAGSSTAFCISPSGLILTCAHCIAESPENYTTKERWLLFSSGFAVRAKPLAYDSQRDLALLQITIAPDSCKSNAFPYITVLPSPPTPLTPLLCIGNPGSEDLETSSTDIIETGYDVLHISEGRFRGLEKGQDVQDNAEIGALKHDCWTYWGHSGAPLIGKRSGRLVGVHSSWDEETGMRRGVAWEAVEEFLVEYCEVENVAGGGASLDDPIVL